jgi:hypothetical protein
VTQRTSHLRFCTEKSFWHIRYYLKSETRRTQTKEFTRSRGEELRWRRLEPRGWQRALKTYRTLCLLPALVQPSSILQTFSQPRHVDQINVLSPPSAGLGIHLPSTSSFQSFDQLNVSCPSSALLKQIAFSYTRFFHPSTTIFYQLMTVPHSTLNRSSFIDLNRLADTLATEATPRALNCLTLHHRFTSKQAHSNFPPHQHTFIQVVS